MKILLCDRITGMFFQADEQWTSDAGRAKDFHTSPKAILFATEHGLNGVEVYWDFDDPEYNVHLPSSSEENQMAA